MVEQPTEGVEGSSPAAAVRTGDGAESPAPRLRVSWYRDGLLISTVLTIFVVDQLSKLIVKSTMLPYESWPLEGFIQITYGSNSGTAFGLFPDQTFILIIASFFAIGFLYYFYKTHALPSAILRLSIGLQLGGAFGNLLDRVRSGEVVDFIDVGWWPIFNVADSSIVIGIALLVTAVMLGEKTGAARGEPETPD